MKCKQFKFNKFFLKKFQNDNNNNNNNVFSNFTFQNADDNDDQVIKTNLLRIKKISVGKHKKVEISK